ncbi:3'(2'),5'-bisphosphate nucleotidase CysQ family protein [Zavarzinella formosa]|uniref:3'(2'),5'-bisphosphate nucleotidase CysQ family protein n=1 Tax=Zavarzinella formosa TaxID=360055 RepID=UPI0002EE4E75|nr:3'(2'),5'-bisphosphate nucleotidase CysQ [Zavarzinella formosa]
MKPYLVELEAAMKAARMASEYLRGAYEEFQAIPDAPVSISTEADRQSQEIILQFLSGQFPLDRLCAEENTPTLQHTPTTGDRVWVVDPIDGTRGFVMKNGEFSVMIGLMDCGKIVVGVVAESALDRFTFATAGGGCWVKTGDGEPQPCRVTSVAVLADSTLIQSHAKPGRSNPPVEAVQPRRVMETYSAGVKLAMVARGDGDLYVNTYAKFADWDICAGHLLVTEAGGTVTEFNGTPLKYGQPKFAQNGGLLAANAVLHPLAIKALRSVSLG